MFREKSEVIHEPSTAIVMFNSLACIIILNYVVVHRLS